MATYTDKRIRELLDDMADSVALPVAPEQTTAERLAYAVGSVRYLIWEARKLLDMPDREDCKPL